MLDPGLLPPDALFIMQVFDSRFLPATFALCLLQFLFGPRAEAEQKLRMPNIFGEQMVLQRDKPIRIWGWAGAECPVVVSFAGQSQSTAADRDGKWEVLLQALPAHSSGQAFTVKSRDELLSLSLIHISEPTRLLSIAESRVCV